MSDSFDHEWDAWNSRDMEDDACGVSYIIDKLYYHVKLKYNSIASETEKSFLIKFYDNDDLTLWIPKKIIREHDLDVKTFYVHKETFMKIYQNYKESIKNGP
jgi:hypothetical protein